MSRQITVTAFAGLDETATQVDSLAISPDMCNFRVTSAGTLQKRPGISAVCDAGDAINGMWCGYLGSSFHFLVVKDSNLWELDTEEGTLTVYGDVGDGKCAMFQFGGYVYILNGNKYSRFNGSGVSEVSGYVPVVAITCPPSGGGTPFESVNLLSNLRKQRFSADGTAAYHLAEQNITSISTVTVNGVNEINYTTDTTLGIVTFGAGHIPAEGVDNVEITYNKTGNPKTRITNCRFAMLFGGNVDGRVFLWGNPQYPNYRFYSELANGLPSVEYFPESNYTVIGNTEITDITSQYDRQLIFTRDKAFYSLCELRQDVLGNYYTSFPVYNLNGEKGNLIKGCGCIVDNEPVTLCSDGLNRWVSTSVNNEKNAVCFSAPVSVGIRQIINGGAFDNVKLFDFQSASEMYFVNGSTVYVYNYRGKTWYKYDGFSPELMLDCKGTLFFSSGNKIYKLDESACDDGNTAVTAHWSSPFCAFGEPESRKNVEEISFGLITKSKSTLVVAASDDITPNTAPFVTFSTETAGVTHRAYRLNRKRVSKARVAFLSNTAETDAEICMLSVRTSTKGGNMKNGLQ